MFAAATGYAQSDSLKLAMPGNVKTDVEYDPATRSYDFTPRIGDSLRAGPSSSMSIKEYMDYSLEKSVDDYWKEKIKAESFNQSKGFRPELNLENETIDRIFGGSKVDIRANGNAELNFGIRISKTENPALPVQQQEQTTFDFNEKIQLNVIGSIGDKMKLTTSYNTEATFEFENQMKLEYSGQEDEIIQKIEAGNVTLPLKGSLITGSQSLFGLKTELKFGRLTVTSVISQQKGEKSEIETQGGAQITDFEVTADKYEQNKHYFLNQYFRDIYESSLESPPLITSGIMITKMEVWVTNTTNKFENTRNILAFQDLGESDASHFYNQGYVSDNSTTSLIPHNDANDLYSTMNATNGIRDFISSSIILDGMGLQARRDYQKVDMARKLQETEYSFQPQLGYISLNQELNPNQVLAVSYQFTYRGKTYQVGEFSTDGATGQQGLLLKMLKGTELNTRFPMWDLMMKNIYPIGAYQLQKAGFFLELWYLNAQTGVDINFMPEGKVKGEQLIRVMNLDRLNMQSALTPDGVFDFVEGLTILPSNGRVIFPVLEPFGSHLRKLYGDDRIADKYCFDSLYTTTQANAKVKFPAKNRFKLKGTYKSTSSSDINLNAFNVPEGSVTVSAGGKILVENVDYQVDYTIGRVKIINQSYLESGTPIKVSLESQSMFNIQSRTLFATRFDYTISDDFVVGGTFMNLTERPLTRKINVGNEPMSNSIWGVDGTYKTESALLTKLVDKIPLINTKAASSVTLSGEFAQLIPGHSDAIGDNGTAYIDDFEGSQSSINIKEFTNWKMASTPQGQPDLFPEGELTNNLANGFNRAKLAWYVMDPLFFRNTSTTPAHIANDPAMQSNHFMRQVSQTEVFPNKQLPAGQPTNIPTLDLAFYPSERGTYNYDVDGTSGDDPKAYSSGTTPEGELVDPEDRWAGIMRRIETPDFDASNVEFIQFWLMDPYAEIEDANYPGADVDGQLYFNLGSISEDILRDSYKSFENGLPADGAAPLSPAESLTAWGRVDPALASVVNAFDNNPESRKHQDVGLDGLSTEQEKVFFKEQYLDRLAQLHGSSSAAYTKALEDPSSDDYNFYRDDNYDASQTDILNRYKSYNGLEGNSPTSEQYAAQNNDGYSTSASTLPNVEDINRDNTMEDMEAYYQYRLDINPSEINPEAVGRKYITDVLQATVSTPDGASREVNWYQFKIPIRDFQKAVGGIADFRSIRFMRMFMRGFKKPIFLRFARLELMRGEWRKYEGDLQSDGESLQQDNITRFDVAAVNLEENGNKTPVNYVIPPDILREQNMATANQQLLNEQSMAVDVCGLEDGKAVAAYRSFNLDVRSYKKLRLYVHAEAANDLEILNDNDLRIFVRIGTDFENNYYEYEVPLKVTPKGFYDGADPSAQKEVWPTLNNVTIEFKNLFDAKNQRNRAGANILSRYMVNDNPINNGGAAKIYVVGNPNLSTVRNIMIGVRNPNINETLNGDGDDGMAKCAEIWVNELRLTDFDENGGWATIGRVTTKLADFATVSLSGAMSTPGFGSIEKKVSERQRETITQLDGSATVELGKFIPEKVGLRIPMYVGFSEGVSSPQFAPQSPDMPIELYQEQFLFHEDKDTALMIAQTVTTRRSINFTNVRKEPAKGKKKSHFYDVSNLSATYAYSEQDFHDYNTQQDLVKNHRGGLTYNFNAKPKNKKPFSKVPFLKKSKMLRPIRDFNFYPGPKQLGFRTDITRMYGERILRPLVEGMNQQDPFYNKNFTWVRQYNMKYDLTRSLKVDFNATNNGLILESPGIIPNTLQDSIINRSIRDFGTTTDYRHNFNVTYNLPFSKFPLTKWINSTLRYSSSYNWNRAAFATEQFGNTLQNSRQIQLNGTFNITTLYNSIPYLRKVNSKFKKSKRSRNRTRGKQKGKGKGKDKDKDKDKKDDKNKITVVDRVVHMFMAVKNISGTYSRNQGILLPGYNQRTNVVGMNPGFHSPGAGFILGQQEYLGAEEGYAEYAALRGWLVKEQDLPTQYASTYTETMNLRATIEPVKDFRFELTANNSRSFNEGSFYRYNEEVRDNGYYGFEHQSRIGTGNYSTSIGTWSTSFVEDDDEYNNDVYRQFLANRMEVSQKLNREGVTDRRGATHRDEAGYARGYGSTSPDVLIPAFLSAYSGKSVDAQGTSAFMSIPIPNWSLRYTGLSKVKKLKKYVKTVSINHAYRSTFSVASYTSNLLFTGHPADPHQPRGDTLDLNGNFIPENQIGTVTISEQFSPLINVDITWQNSLLTRFEYKRDRNISLSFANNQMTEVTGSEIVIGAGYRFSQVKLPFQLKPGQTIQSDLNLRADIAIRSNRTVIRKIVEGINQATAGQSTITIKVTADYAISDRLNLRLFYDKVVNNPVVSTSFPTANTNMGISVRFTLAS